MKIISRSILVNIAIQLAINSSSAQTVWESGYLITHTRDTIHGSIEYKDWTVSPESILFRQGPANDIKQYNADEIRGFMLTSKNGVFHAEKVTINYYSKALNMENNNPLEKVDSIYAFLQVLINNGTLALLKYMDEYEEPRFFIEKGDSLTQLVNIEYLVSKSGRIAKVAYPFYKTQLATLLGDCQAIDTKNIVYHEREFIKLVNRYFACTNQHYDYEADKQRFIINIGLNGGLNHYAGGTGSFAGFSIQHLIDKKFSSRFIQIGIGKLFVPPNSYTVNGQSQTRNNIIYYSIYGGKYLGHKRIKPVIFTGFSRLNGGFDTGIGLSADKRFTITCQTGLYDLLFKSIPNVSLEARLSLFRNGK